MHRLVVWLRRVAVEHPEGHRIFRLLHVGQHHGQHLVGLVVDEDVVGRRAVVSDFDDLDPEPVGAAGDAPVALLPENQRLSVLDGDRVVGHCGLVGPAGEGAVVVDDAVLHDFDEGRALVRVRGLEHARHVLLVCVEGARHESRAGPEREAAGVDRRIDGSLRRRRRSGAKLAGRRVLTLGEAVNLVVEQQHVDVDVAAQRVKRVIAADRQRVAVAHHEPYVEFRIGQLGARGERRRAAVNGVEAVRGHVIGKSGGAADAGEEDQILQRNLQLRKRPVNVLDDGVIAAARAPADFLVGSVIGRLESFRGGFDVHRTNPLCANGFHVREWRP